MTEPLETAPPFHKVWRAATTITTNLAPNQGSSPPFLLTGSFLFIVGTDDRTPRNGSAVSQGLACSHYDHRQLGAKFCTRQERSAMFSGFALRNGGCLNRRGKLDGVRRRRTPPYISKQKGRHTSVYLPFLIRYSAVSSVGASAAAGAAGGAAFFFLPMARMRK